MRFLIALLAICACAQDAGWQRHVIAEGFRNQTAIAADFTGDGRMDVISGDIGDKTERVLLFIAPDWKPVVLHSGIRTIHSAVIDVDGDGDPDFVGARYHPGLVYWLERPQNPASDPWPYHLADDADKGGIDGIHGLMAGDIDRDGRLDLVASSGQPKGSFPDSLAWFSITPGGSGKATWKRHIIADRDAPGLSHYVGIGDVNGDGRPDVASAAKDSPGGNWFAWWEQPKDPRNAWSRRWIAQNQLAATNILIADFNGDRRADFAGSRGHGLGVVWYEAPAWTPHELSPRLKEVHALATGDIDRDGDTDIAVVAMGSRIAAWFQNDGKGNFTFRQVHNDQSAYDLRLVDMDRDGDLDMLVAGFASSNVVWYENRLPAR